MAGGRIELISLTKRFTEIAFGLRNRRLDRRELTSRVNEALDLVKLGSFAKCRPGQLGR
jgi:energy-coupling factor transporter ATP-binding protein EcfA2